MTTKIFIDFFKLFFPRTCRCCGNILLNSENQICTYCISHLPLTNFVNMVNNPVEKKLWGRGKIEAATSLLFFSKKGNVQKILHEIKYKRNINLAHLMGNQLGIELKKSNRFSDVDIIIPVPLHPKKQKQRGYNQSEEIAKGMINHFKKEINTTTLIKTTYTKSQTKQKRFSRWENVSENFSVINTSEIKTKHILLVDDVITTGATLEACIKELLKIPEVKISIATLAYTDN